MERLDGNQARGNDKGWVILVYIKQIFTPSTFILHELEKNAEGSVLLAMVIDLSIHPIPTTDLPDAPILMASCLHDDFIRGLRQVWHPVDYCQAYILPEGRGGPNWHDTQTVQYPRQCPRPLGTITQETFLTLLFGASSSSSSSWWSSSEISFDCVLKSRSILFFRFLTIDQGNQHGRDLMTFRML